MTHLERFVPKFVEDAFESDAVLDRELVRVLDALPHLLEPVEVCGGSARLLAEVSNLPLRYAPFFERIGRLWQLDEASVVAVLSRAADPKAWRKPGLPGMRVMDVTGGPGLEGASLHLVRFSPGMRYPAHRHLGPEALFVLEGSYEDDSGRVVGPGELHEMPVDTEHRFKVGSREPCVAASIQSGFAFTGPLMRVLVRLFG